MAMMCVTITVFALTFAHVHGSILPTKGYADGVLSMSEEIINNNLQLSKRTSSISGVGLKDRINSAEDDVLYYLYTKENIPAYQLYKNNWEVLRRSAFNASRPTKIAIHGYEKNFLDDSVQLVKEAYINSPQDVNVIGVDWSALCRSPWYPAAVKNTELVGEQIAQMVDFLVAYGADANEFHLIGHSLGAHIMGFVANYISSGNITRITGLDPALPLFSNRPPSERLDLSDADFVDCIHTCSGVKGFYQPICTADFYPNGGKMHQPGCELLQDITGTCSHHRSVKYFAESVADLFPAVRCSSLDQVKSKTCEGTAAVMGDSANISASGIYYLDTNSEYPFAKLTAS